MIKSWLSKREGTMFCSKCGAKMIEGSAFCTACGTEQSKVVESRVATSMVTANQPARIQPGFGFRCPFCQHQGPPIITEKVSGGGWVLFVVLLLLCFPLCWLPFVLKGCKEEIRRCASCGTKLG